jgi:hypothetical protein
LNESQNELPRPVNLSLLGREGPLTLQIEADPAERAAIARRLGLPAIESLKADIEVTAEGMEGAHLSGTIRSALTQTCVVTLEPLAVTIEEPLDVHFVPPSALPPGDESIDPEAPDPPEALPASGIIEAGEVVIQHLAVALDPYPRKPGALFVHESPGQEPPAGPFAKLAALKARQKG